MVVALSARDERRLAARHPAVREDDPATLKLRTGATIVVVNHSPTGLLVESPVRLTPGAAIEVRSHTPEGTGPTRAVVVHCRVCGVDRLRGLRYRAGLHFVAGNDYPARANPSMRGKSLHSGSGQGHPFNTGSPRPLWPSGWHADC